INFEMSGGPFFSAARKRACDHSATLGGEKAQDGSLRLPARSYPLNRDRLALRWKGGKQFKRNEAGGLLKSPYLRLDCHVGLDLSEFLFLDTGDTHQIFYSFKRTVRTSILHNPPGHPKS